MAEIEKLNDVIDSDSDTDERGALSGRTYQLISHCSVFFLTVGFVVGTFASFVSFAEEEYLNGWAVEAR